MVFANYILYIRMRFIIKIKYFIISLLVLGVTLAVNKETGLVALDTIAFSFKEMIMVLPPIFILIGLLDVWVPSETMAKYMGEDSGLVGILLSIFLGSAAAGPLYGAFPVAAVFMKKDVKLTNIFIFIGAWSTTKLPMFLFEMTSLGSKFALTRLAINIPGILIIAYLVRSALTEEDVREMYKRVGTL